jgi:hypothetical protein
LTSYVRSELYVSYANLAALIYRLPDVDRSYSLYKKAFAGYTKVFGLGHSETERIKMCVKVCEDTLQQREGRIDDELLERAMIGVMPNVEKLSLLEKIKTNGGNFFKRSKFQDAVDSWMRATGIENLSSHKYYIRNEINLCTSLWK